MDVVRWRTWSALKGDFKGITFRCNHDRVQLNSGSNANQSGWIGRRASTSCRRTFGTGCDIFLCPSLGLARLALESSDPYLL